jgi:putative sterol carrier protein
MPWVTLETTRSFPALSPCDDGPHHTAFRCRFEDWLDVAAGRRDPWRALISGRIRPRGEVRMLARAPKLFG